MPVARLDSVSQGWFLSGEIAQHSAATLAKRRLMIAKLLWFLRQKEYPSCGVMELRSFFAYLSDKKPIDGGRWGNPQETKPVKPGTVAAYHATVRAFFAWAVAEGEIDVSPMVRIPAPIDRPDQIIPFTADQIDALSCRREEESPAEARRSHSSVSTRYRRSRLGTVFPALSGRGYQRTAGFGGRQGRQDTLDFLCQNDRESPVELSARGRARVGRSGLCQRTRRTVDPERLAAASGAIGEGGRDHRRSLFAPYFPAYLGSNLPESRRQSVQPYGDVGPYGYKDDGPVRETRRGGRTGPAHAIFAGRSHEEGKKEMKLRHEPKGTFCSCRPSVLVYCETAQNYRIIFALRSCGKPASIGRVKILLIGEATALRQSR